MEINPIQPFDTIFLSVVIDANYLIQAKKYYFYKGYFILSSQI